MSAPDAPRADAEGASELEHIARGIAARKMLLVKDPLGVNLPDDLWRQAIPDALAYLRDAVVAAARVWKETRRNMGSPWLDVVGAATRLERAVDAYEAATGGRENG